jgi:hypothetical protein
MGWIMAIGNIVFSKRKIMVLFLCVFIMAGGVYAIYYLSMYTTEGIMFVESVKEADDGHIYIYVKPNGTTVCLSCKKDLITDAGSIICDKDVLYDICFESSSFHPEKGKLISIDTKEFIDNRRE